MSLLERFYPNVLFIIKYEFITFVFDINVYKLMPPCWAWLGLGAGDGLRERLGAELSRVNQK